MYQYKQVLMRMRQGNSGRDIARAKMMGCKKIAQFRELANRYGWLAADSFIPDEQLLVNLLQHNPALPTHHISGLEPWRAQIAAGMILRRNNKLGGAKAFHQNLERR